MILRLLTKTGAIFDYILRVLFVLASIILVFIWMSVSFEVVARYFFNRPTIWVFDFTTVSLAFVIFLSVAWVLKKEGHVRMDIVRNLLNPRNQALLNMVTSIFGAIMWLVITFYSAQVTWSLFLEREHLVTVTELPKAPLVAVIPVGSFLLFIQLLRMTYGYLRSWGAARDRKQGL